MLWLLLAAALLAVLLCRMRIGVRAAYGQGGRFRLAVRAGPLRIRLLPAREKKTRKGKKPERPGKEPAKDGKPEMKKLPFTWEDAQDALRTLLPALGRELRRTCRGVRIKPLRASLALGGQEDPAGAARLCGQLYAIVWGVMPQLERLVDIQDPEIHIGVDFQAPAPVAEGETEVTFRFGTLAAAGFGLAVPALKWLLRCRRRHKAKPSEPEKKEPVEDSAA